MNNFTRSIAVSLILLSSFLVQSPAEALWFFGKAAAKGIAPLIKHSMVLKAEKIDDLASLAKAPGGTKAVGQALGRQNLPPSVLEDTYMRIAIKQNKIDRAEAETMMVNLGGVSGFRSTISKIIGNSDVKTSGHLNELRIANGARQSGFKVLSVGEKFNDGLKSAPTDIDVLLQKNGKVIAIEAKDYKATTQIPMVDFRKDMKSLSAYAESGLALPVIKVFSITNKPDNEISWKLLKYEAKRNGVELIVGNPAEQIQQINMLSKMGR